MNMVDLFCARYRFVRDRVQISKVWWQDFPMVLQGYSESKTKGSVRVLPRKFPR
ncbi:MAG: hypothetical protein ACLVGL_17875 [Waltera sp.]